MPSTDRWLSTAEAALILGVSRSKVRGLIRAGKLRAIQDTEGGKLRIRESECMRYLAQLEAAAVQMAAA